MLLAAHALFQAVDVIGQIAAGRASADKECLEQHGLTFSPCETFCKRCRFLWQRQTLVDHALEQLQAQGLSVLCAKQFFSVGGADFGTIDKIGGIQQLSGDLTFPLPALRGEPCSLFTGPGILVFPCIPEQVCHGAVQ